MEEISAVMACTNVHVPSSSRAAWAAAESGDAPPILLAPKASPALPVLGPEEVAAAAAAAAARSLLALRCCAMAAEAAASPASASTAAKEQSQTPSPATWP